MSRRFALVIGNSEYEDATLAKLKTPEADVQTLAATLRDPQVGGFDDVLEMVNQSEASVRRAISQFFLQKKSDDLLLLYFSGHGVLDAQGRLFLAVKDTQRELLNATAIPSSFISDDMDSCRSKRQILILDCCHSGAFAKGSKGDAPAVTQTTFEGNGFGRVVLTASDSTQYALEGDQVIEQASLSLFTHYLLEGLTTGEADSAQDGWVTLDEWYDYAYDRVVSETPEQTPRKWAYNQQGELVIARNPNPLPADLPEQLNQAIESNFAGVRLEAVEELKRLLSGSSSPQSQAAYQALRKLAENDDSRRVAAAAGSALTSFDPLWHLREPEQVAQTDPTRIEQKYQEKMARQEAETARREWERAETERKAKEKAEAEKLASSRQKAEAERLAAQKAQAEKQRRQQAEAERQARQKAEADRQAEAAQKAQAEQQMRQQAEAERLVSKLKQPVTYLSFESELNPRQVNAGATAQLAISVPGQAPASLTVGFVDPVGKLIFSPPGAQLSVQPGVNTIIRFRAALRRPALVGFKSKYPFEIHIRASTGETQALAGDVIARPLVPVWSLPVVGLIGLCLTASILYLAVILPSRNEAAKNTTATYMAALAMLATATPPPSLETTAVPTTQVSTQPASSISQRPTNTLARLTSTTVPLNQSTSPPQPPQPIFTASQDMFCRDGPGINYQAHVTIIEGQILPVLRAWSDGYWLLVGIDRTDTRTKCCWVGGEGTLNVDRSSIQKIDYLPDRISCNLTP